MESNYLQLWSSPVLLILAFYFLWDFMGAPMLAGIGVMVVLMPANGIVTKYYSHTNLKKNSRFFY